MAGVRLAWTITEFFALCLSLFGKRSMKPSLYSFARLLGAALLFMGWMYKEWLDKTTAGIREASPLFGPFHFVTDAAPPNVTFGVLLCIGLIPLIFAFVVKPQFFTAILSLIGLLLWLFFGLVGAGINA